jgi:thioester reductase-like protein
LLHDLLTQTAATLICLVRATSPGEARSRIEENLTRYGLAPTPAQWQRIEACPGDLARHQLGFGDKVWTELAARVDTVVHGAAAVNFYQDYRRLRAVNVVGVREILRFTVAGRTKALHYVSSTGVFDSEAYRGVTVSEADNPAHCHGSVMGYTQTKWVAEQLVLQSRVRGVPASVYRPPFIMGDSRTGAVDAENLVVKTLIGSIQGGCWPADVLSNVEMIPVDALSRAIVHFIRDPAFHGRTFHLTSPRRMRWVDIGQAARDHGYAVDMTSYDEWLRRLLHFGRQPGNALRPLMRFYTKVTSRAGVPVPEIFARQSPPVFESTVTQAALSEAGVVMPGMTPALFGTYLNYFVRAGWLPPLPKASKGNSRPPYAVCK